MEICTSLYLNVDESPIDVWGAHYVDDLSIYCCPLKLTATQRVATWCQCAQRLAGHAHVEIMKTLACRRKEWYQGILLNLANL